MRRGSRGFLRYLREVRTLSSLDRLISRLYCPSGQSTERRPRHELDGRGASQLHTYCANVTLDKLTDEERGRPGEPGDEHSCLGYDAAMQLPIERLRELKKADDWGSAWELHDGEQNEYHYQDEGAMEACRQILAVLTEEANRG